MTLSLSQKIQLPFFCLKHDASRFLKGMELYEHVNWLSGSVICFNTMTIPIPQQKVFRAAVKIGIYIHRLCFTLNCFKTGGDIKSRKPFFLVHLQRFCLALFANWFVAIKSLQEKTIQYCNRMLITKFYDHILTPFHGLEPLFIEKR